MVQGNATDYHLAWLAVLCVLYCRASTHRPRVIDLKTTGTRRPVTVQADEDEVAYVIDNACPTVRESLREMAADQYSADLTVAGCRSLTTAPDIVQALANYLNKRGELEKPITTAELLAHAAIYRQEHPLEDAGVVATPPRRASRGLLALAVAYAFGLPILGLQEKAGCLMFSQLRMHGGSEPPPAADGAAAARARRRRSDLGVCRRRRSRRVDQPLVGRQRVCRPPRAALAPCRPRGRARAGRVYLGREGGVERARRAAAALPGATRSRTSGCASSSPPPCGSTMRSGYGTRVSTAWWATRRGAPPPAAPSTF